MPTLDDTMEEGPETFFVNLSNPVGGDIQDNQGEATILDNDPLPTKFYVLDDASTDRTYEYNNATSLPTGSSKAADASFATASGNTNPQGIADPPVASAPVSSATAGSGIDTFLVSLYDTPVKNASAAPRARPGGWGRVCEPPVKPVGCSRDCEPPAERPGR